jgi:hypothetical protein
MKPNLVNKNLIYDMVGKKKDIIIGIKKEKNILFFNFLVILFFIFCGLILLFRYLDKKKYIKEDKKNIS